MVKNLPANSGDARDMGSIPGSRRSPGVGNGNLLQYSRLENPMDRGAWRDTVHGVAQSRTRLKRLSTSSSILTEGLPRWCSGKELVCQCRRCKRHGFDPWVGKIP